MLVTDDRSVRICALGICDSCVFDVGIAIMWLDRGSYMRKAVVTESDLHDGCPTAGSFLSSPAFIAISSRRFSSLDGVSPLCGQTWASQHTQCCVNQWPVLIHLRANPQVYARVSRKGTWQRHDLPNAGMAKRRNNYLLDTQRQTPRTSATTGRIALACTQTLQSPVTRLHPVPSTAPCGEVEFQIRPPQSGMSSHVVEVSKRVRTKGLDRPACSRQLAPRPYTMPGNNGFR